MHDRVVIQELLKKVAQANQIDTASQKDFKGKRYKLFVEFSLYVMNKEYSVCNVLYNGRQSVSKRLIFNACVETIGINLNVYQHVYTSYKLAKTTLLNAWMNMTACNLIVLNKLGSHRSISQNSQWFPHGRESLENQGKWENIFQSGNRLEKSGSFTQNTGKSEVNSASFYFWLIWHL